MSVIYSELDQLILSRWSDVVGLIEAHRSLQDRMEQVIDATADRVGRWARPLGFEVEPAARYGEIHAWRPSWADRKKGSRVYLALGGLCPMGFRKVEDPYPFLWVYVNSLEKFRIKEQDRMAFSRSLRAALGDRARDWEAHDVDDADAPLGRYLSQYDNDARAKLVADPDALFAFCTEHFPTLFELADEIDAEIQRLGR